MPRGPRLDTPDALHHVMARGIDRQTIFRDDHDRDDLLQRLSDLVRDRQVKVYAWALLPNHFHLLVRTGERPLERSMRSLLTGFASVFNRRHGRVGHLFQNRYKSIVCDAERYFLELVRYIHLNPLRAGIVPSFDALEAYPYTGHSALMAAFPRDWQATEAVLERFGRSPAWGRAAYRRFVSDGVPLGRRPELVGGGLVRNAGGWKAVAELRRGREVFVADERVLGDDRFVDRILREVRTTPQQPDPSRPLDIQSLKGLVSTACGVSADSLSAPGRARAISRARDGVAYLWLEFLGRSGRMLALDLGMKPQAIYKAAQRGRKDREQWIRLVEGSENSN